MNDEANKVRLPAEMATEFRNPEWGAKQLSGIAIFKGLSTDELKAIYSQGEILSYKQKSYAVIEGEPTRGLFIILSGTVSVYKNDQSTGAMHRIAYLESGNNFGELSLFDEAPRSASVAAESVCHMFFLDEAIFNQFLAKSGGDVQMRFYKACAEELVSRFRKLNSDYIVSQQLLWKHAFTKEKAEPELKPA